MAQTERELKRQWYKTKSSHMLFLRASRSSTVGNLYQAGWRLFSCTYCSVYCFVAEWHIHSQAGLEMNAEYSTTWLFGGFQVFFSSSSFLNASLSQYNTIHTYDSKVEYLQTGFIWTGRHIRKDNSSKFWILPERKQSQPVRSKMYAGSKSSPQFIVILAKSLPVLITPLWMETQFFIVLKFLPNMRHQLYKVIHYWFSSSSALPSQSIDVIPFINMG